MPTVTVEDGSNVAGANSYISRADATIYFDERLYATGWAAAVDADKDRALIQAATMLDGLWQWNGYKTNESQPMQWPRFEVPDIDRSGSVFPSIAFRQTNYLDENSIPQFLRDAQCELALSLLSTNRLANPSGEGLSAFELTGVLSVDFDLATKIRPMPDHVNAALSKYGYPLFGSGAVKLTRA